MILAISIVHNVRKSKLFVMTGAIFCLLNLTPMLFYNLSSVGGSGAGIWKSMNMIIVYADLWHSGSLLFMQK